MKLIHQDTIEVLQELVEGLEDTHWSSWQSTWKFDPALLKAVEYLKELKENDDL